MKKIICLVAVTLASISNASAQTFSGSYCEHFDYIAEHNSRYGFASHGSFDYQFWDDVQTIYGSGSYLVRNDSLILNYKLLPTEFKSLHITSAANNKQVSSFFVVNPIVSMPNWYCYYQIFEGDSMLLSGKCNHYGRFETRLEEGQTVKIVATYSRPFGSFIEPIQFEIKGQIQQNDYVVFATGIMPYTQIITTHTKGFPIRFKKRGEQFAIKVNDTWIWYEICV